MKFGTSRESPNYVDLTGMPDMMKNLLGYNPYQQFNDADKINYQKWLTDRLNQLSPQDYYLMQHNGMSLQDLDNYHALMRQQQ